MATYSPSPDVNAFLVSLRAAGIELPAGSLELARKACVTQGLSASGALAAGAQGVVGVSSGSFPVGAQGFDSGVGRAGYSAPVGVAAGAQVAQGSVLVFSVGVAGSVAPGVAANV